MWRIRKDHQIPPSCDEFGPNLPPELIAAILSRLPVKSLLRFRCICKSWRSLISHPKFVKTHLSLASINTAYTHHRLLLRRDYRTNDVKSCSLYAVLHERSDNDVELDCPIKTPHRYWFGDLFVGCCDGLVCIAIEREVCIWNPSTRKSKSLERRAITWRGTFVKRALHWIVRMKSNVIIVSLDLAKETFAEVLQPDYRDDRWYETLFVLNGCLGMLCGNNACADIWVMKQCGIRESWTNLVVIPRVPYQSGYPYSPPLCILKNGEILLKNDLHLVRYNPKDGKFSYPTIHNCSPCFSANSYVESLVLPCMDADSGVQLQHRY
ncbi:hypothetical protein RHMOL_Rhmol05G0232800 [Rhododendron molle]|uniref:Uncharacterized protein n=1 Tax=Rhododendron molle TaxID=49168 RepID=A0ACC0NTF0_RHOML|nr:hypothetical protein RHMOL_Rhmol05G0232800 [Rhododendron molle]